MVRSVPIEKALDDVLIALYQNGERLRPEQGYPMRLFAPGWEGNLNVKWLHRLKVTDGPAHARDETDDYTDLLPDGTARQFTFVMGVKSVITHPSGGLAMGPPGFYEISGLSWSGHGSIRRVEVSADGGASWADAALDGVVLPRCLTRFRIPWAWEGAPAVLMSRATDDQGNVQPTREVVVARYAASNRYHNHAIQSWSVSASGEVANVYA
jgi:sulfane dehydrogenase subunit SoxC